VDVKNTLTRKTRFVCPQNVVKKGHPHRVDVLAIRKIASVEDDHVETDLHSTSSGMDTIDCHEVLRAPSVGIVPILVRHRVRFPTALVL
jgi:predicted hotdog family 3-hydroxylacyl-ACP dehydratase